MSKKFLVDLEDDHYTLDDSELGNVYTRPPPPDIHEEPKEFHLAGKHDQKAHGRGGKGRKGKGSFPYSSDNEKAMSIASADGKVPAAMAGAISRGEMSKEEIDEAKGMLKDYHENQVATLDFLQKDEAAYDAAKMRADGGDLYSGADEQGISFDNITHQKIRNAERLADRMGGELSDLSDEEILAVRDNMDRFGLGTGPGQSTTTKGLIGKPNFEQAGEGHRFVTKMRDGEVVKVRVTDREAALNDISNGLIRSHAKTADQGFPPATAIQDSVNRQYIEPSGGGASLHYRRVPALTTEAWVSKGKTQRVVDAYVKSTYEETQAAFKKAGITEVVLHRGTTRPAAKSGVAKVRLSPISSYSRSRNVADSFAQKKMVLTTKFNVADIWSTSATGAGCYREEEFIVMGGIHSTYIDDTRG